jgi:hypothetical protein
MPLMVPVCPCTGKSPFILSTQWFFWQPHDSWADIIHLNDFLISLNFFSIIRFKRSILQIQVGMTCVWYFSKVSIIKGDKNIFGIYIFELIHYQKTSKNQWNYRRNFFVSNNSVSKSVGIYRRHKFVGDTVGIYRPDHRQPIKFVWKDATVWWRGVFLDDFTDGMTEGFKLR